MLVSLACVHTAFSGGLHLMKRLPDDSGLHATRIGRVPRGLGYPQLAARFNRQASMQTVRQSDGEV
jgi:hypothetical protein